MMASGSQIFFNLLINCSFSFFAGLLVVLLALWIFKINDSGWRLFLLSLPFVKIPWDLLYRGIPTSSIVRAGLDPMSFPPKHQTLTIGAGFSKFGPIFNFIFACQAPDGKQYSTSAADYLFFGIVRKFGSPTLHGILGAMVGISLFLVARRFLAATQFEIQRKNHRNSDDEALTPVNLRSRKVDVYVSSHYTGTPFTGGFLKPYICIPHDALSKLTATEQSAVIQHEIAHIRHGDLWVTFAIKTLGDLLWFVPAYRRLSKQIDRLREILADQTAVRSGADPTHLASALLKLKEIPDDNGHAVLYSAFFREKSLLKKRIENLTGQSHAPTPRFGWQNRWVRMLVTAWTTGGVMLATFGGNHSVTVQDVTPQVANFLHRLGLM